MTFGVSPDFYDKMCKHQFFEVKDIGYQPIGSMLIEGKEQMVMEPYKGGKLVMCAVCGERRQLWENGDILFFLDGNWQKLPGM